MVVSGYRVPVVTESLIPERLLILAADAVEIIHRVLAVTMFHFPAYSLIAAVFVTETVLPVPRNCDVIKGKGA